MPEPSSSSVADTSPRRKEIEEAVTAYAADLFALHPEVVEVIWFGSWVTGHPSRYSDVDLCLLLKTSSIPRIRDRIPCYLPDAFPGGLDIFPYTQEEFDALRTTAPAWWQAIQRGMRVLSRTKPYPSLPPLTKGRNKRVASKGEEHDWESSP